jgi:molybdopterin-guanine dinucleotide biosynthesis protein A
MAARVAAALRAAGADPVVAVGGDVAALAARGLTVWPDGHPGEGPLGAIATVLALALTPVVVVAACDLPWLDEASVAAVLAALAGAPGAAVAVARTDRTEPLLSAWRVAAAGPVVAAAFAAGERAVHAALDRLAVVEVAVAAGPLRNVNRPGDLPG